MHPVTDYSERKHIIFPTTMKLKVFPLQEDCSVQEECRMGRKRKAKKVSLGLRVVGTVRGLAEGSWIMVPDEFLSGVDQCK